MNFRSALVQIAMVGCLAFCCPGMFNAMTGLGGAGNANADSAAAANAALYACFAVFGYFGGAFFNLFGNKVLMCVGGACYCFYAIGQYFAAVYEGLGWLAILSGAVLGFGAGWFWTAQGAMMMAYATPERKGEYISLFWIIFNLGGMIGGFLSFGLNYNESSGQASAVSYFTFVGLMALGSLGALFLLVKPSSVVREDNEPVVFEKAQSAIAEIKGALSVATNKYMILLMIPFISSNWFYTYQFNGYNLNLFNIRSRGFNSAVYWGSQMLGSWILGKVLDAKMSTKKRGQWGLIILAVEFNLAYILGAVVQYSYYGGFERKHPPETNRTDEIYANYIQEQVKCNGMVGEDLTKCIDKATEAYHEAMKYDVGSFGAFVFPFFVFLLYGLGDAMLQTYAYWVMGAIAGDDTQLCARYAGFYKGIQSLGACVAWSLDLGVDYKPQFWICWALFLVSLPLFFLVNNDLPDDDDVVHPKAGVLDGIPARVVDLPHTDSYRKEPVN